ncbi:hypothetical protein [Alicyclobacillus fodiniaquatilis]|uniref:Uncharacterized protein n=1 Tax=Alicyclobacillus fodiniaquatilis TaxID=1661150 RepID=A0ABW4JEN6_9BACL
MKFNAKNIEKTQAIVEYMKKGFVTADSLAAQTGLTRRQIYRYFQFGLEHGFLYSPTRGVYCPSDINVVPLNTYAKFNSKNVNVRMSQNKQHNKTKQLRTDFDIADFEDFKVQSFKDQRIIESRLCDINEESQTMSLLDLIVRVLKLANMPYGKRDLNYAVNALGNSAWWLVSEENIEEYTIETVKRMVERLDQDPNAIKTNTVGYFFGIFANVLSADARYIKQVWKKEFIPAYVQMAAGAEEVAVTTNRTEQEEKSVSTHAYRLQEQITEISPNEYAIPLVSSRWLTVQELFKQMVHECTTFGLKTLEPPIARLLAHLDEQDVQVYNVEAAIRDVIEHDKEAANYLIRLVKTNLFKEVETQLDRHFARSIKRLSKIQPSMDKQNVRDDRYKSFYQLFPETDTQQIEIQKVPSKGRDERYSSFYKLFPES